MPLFKTGYALVRQSDTEVKRSPFSDSFAFALLSRGNLVYVSDRRVVSKDDPGRDWMTVHFDSEEGTQRGYVRFARLDPQTAPDALAAVEARLQKAGASARYQGHLLLKLDCALLSEATPEPSAEPTSEPTSEPAEEPAPSTDMPTGEPSEEPIAEATEEAAAEEPLPPAEEPSAEPAEPSAEPAEETAPEPSEEMTADPTEDPLAEATPEVTTEPSEEIPDDPAAEPNEEATLPPAEENPAEPADEVTEAPAEEETPLPAEETSEEPLADPTEGPTEEATLPPDEENPAEPTDEVTEAPAEEETPLPTEEVSEEPAADPTVEPPEEATPLPAEETAADPVDPVADEPAEESTPAPTTDAPAETPMEEPLADPAEEPAPEPAEASAEPAEAPIADRSAVSEEEESIPEATAEPSPELIPELTLEPTPEPTEAPLPLIEAFLLPPEQAEMVVASDALEADLAMPAELPCLVDGEEVSLPVTWQREDEGAAAWVPGSTYAYLPLIPEGFALAGDLPLPRLSVRVRMTDSVQISITPLLAAEGETVSLTAVVTGYEGASFQWQWADIPPVIVELSQDLASRTDDVDVELLRASKAQEAQLVWHDEPGATGLIYTFVAAPDNMNRYWRLVLTLPPGGDADGGQSGGLHWLMCWLLPRARAEEGGTIVSSAYPSLLLSAAPVSEFEYVVVDNEVQITRYIGSASQVTVPDMIDGLPVVSVCIAGPEQETDYTITGVSLPGSVKRLDAYAFSNLAALASVTGLEYVEEVGTAAFEHAGVSTLTFSTALKIIGWSAFGWSKVGQLTIPDDVSLEAYAFSGMEWLRTIILTPGGTAPRYVLNGGALYSADGKELVLLPAFMSPSFVIPQGVTAIDETAISTGNPSLLRTLTIPDSVTAIGGSGSHLAGQFITLYVGAGSYADNLFKSYPGLTVYVISPEHPQGVLQEKQALDPEEKMTEDLFSYRLAGDNAVVTGYFGTEEHLVIPSAIEGLPVRSVSLCRNVSSEGNPYVRVITLPPTVTALLPDAFRDMSNLHTINGLEQLESVGLYAFYATKLQRAVFSAKLREIGRSALENTPLVSLTLPEDFVDPDGTGLLPVGYNQSLREINLIAGVGPARYVMQDGVMYTADMKTLLYCPCEGVTTLRVPDGVTTVRVDAVYAMPDSLLKQIILPRSVTLIEADHALGNALANWWTSLILYVTPGSYTDTLFQAYPELTVNVVDDVDKIGVVDRKAEEVVAAVITEGMDEYQIAIALHDWIAQNAVHDETSAEHDAYGLFFRGSATSEGYAAAYRVLLFKAGIESRVVLPGNGQWMNLVRLGGEWTYIDVATNDNNSNHNHFGMTDSMLSDMFYLPPAGGALAARNALLNHGYKLGLYDDIIAGCVTEIEQLAAGGSKQFSLPYPALTVGAVSNHVAYRIIAEALATKLWNIGSVPYHAFVSYQKDADSYAVLLYPDGSPAVPEGLQFVLVEGSVHITEYTGTATELLIPDQVLGLPVTKIADAAFKGNTTLQKLTIPQGVVTLSDLALADCTALLEVSLPASLSSLGVDSFRGCVQLKEVVIPAAVIKIANGAFWGCERMTKVTLLGKVTQVEASAFANCFALTTINLPDSIALIDLGAFLNCRSLTIDRLPGSLLVLGAHAFHDVRISLLNIPAGLTYIGENFAGQGRNRVRQITVDPANTAYKLVDGMLLSKDGKRLFLYPAESAATSCVIPAGVEKIAGSAFAGAGALTSISFPSGLSYVGPSAFENCVTLQEAILPESLTRIPFAMFMDCKSLRKVQLSSQLQSINSSAFMNCVSLDTLSIPPSVGFLGVWVFTGSGLTSLSIPLGVSKVSDQLVLDGHVREVIAHPWVTALSPLIFEQGVTPTIRGYADTYAETFAQDNGFTFIPIPGERPPAPNYVVDLSEDGFWDEEDIAMISQIILNLDQGMTEEEKAKADVNGDGFVDVGDCVWVINQQ